MNVSAFLGRAEFETACAAIRRRTQHTPQIGLILGSGLGGLAEAVEDADHIPYQNIPHWPSSTVLGHSGQLVIGRFEGHQVMVMQGRAHYYEGYSIDQITLPIRVMQLMGVAALIVTNAAGGLNPAFHAGDLMLISDHIALIAMAGLNPLRGPNDETLGPRFPDMSEAYDVALQALAKRVAARLGIPLQEGVYVCLAGPSFETPADLRFLRTIGADAVGMSTVPEVIVARHGGLRVLGISGISNMARFEPSPEQLTTHDEVLATGQVIVPRLTALIRGILRALPV
jgi:purine-nucleoside phosphorylase